MTSSAQVGDILEDYANRGIFKGFSRQGDALQHAQFKVLWHRQQRFLWAWDDTRQSLRIACVLPAVPAKSPMYRDLKTWLKNRQCDSLPDHRRCDASKVALRTYNKQGDVALTLRILDGDIDYGVRKLVSLVNEIYLDFLSSGLYYDWLLETFELDPDNPY